MLLWQYEILKSDAAAQNTVEAQCFFCLIVAYCFAIILT